MAGLCGGRAYDVRLGIGDATVVEADRYTITGVAVVEGGAVRI